MTDATLLRRFGIKRSDPTFFPTDLATILHDYMDYMEDDVFDANADTDDMDADFYDAHAVEAKMAYRAILAKRIKRVLARDVGPLDESVERRVRAVLEGEDDSE